MSREKRTIRPYTVASGLSSAFKSTEVRLGDDLSCSAGSSLTVDDGTFTRREVWVEWTTESEFDRFCRRLTNAAADTGVHPRWLRLVVVARTGSLKLAEKLLDHGLDRLDDIERCTRLDLDPGGERRPVFCAGTHGTVVDAYVALSPDWTSGSLVERRLPKRAASWLARATFRLEASAQAAVLFQPRPLTEAKREELGLPQGTLRFIDLGGQDLEEAIEGTPDVDVLVDEGTLTALNANRTSAAAVFFQRQLLLDFVSAVVFEYARSADSGTITLYEDVKDSLIGKVVQLIAEPNDEARDRTLRQCRSDPARLVALAEDVLRLREGVNQLFRAAR
ncbi:MAG: hypothetical protein OXF75_02575 [Acidimicrobiaceae bacterium]|nr:hypothetical protein [Acidimicrobiaceae bacterium]